MSAYMVDKERRPVQLGDFFEESWGYDQTNVDFYQVVKISPSGKTVWLRHVETQLVRAAGGPADYVAPLPDEFDEAHTSSRKGLLKRLLKETSWRGQDDVSWYVNMTSYSHAYLWDCKPAYRTAVGWGH